MAVFFYNIFLLLYGVGIHLTSLWNNKAKLWLKGREDLFEKLKSGLGTQHSPVIWFHCSSLGEFEQGRPIIERLRDRFPNSRFLLTFFSPSGYEIRKDYKGVDWVSYLPLDSKANAKRFFDIVNPSLVIFIKYDYWYYYLTECKKRNIPLLMASAIFRNGQPFFKRYGGLHRKMLSCFTHFFVQDDVSKKLLEKIQFQNETVAGDTRFDRVTAIAKKFEPINEIERFCGNSQILVAGSTWPDDERSIKEAVTGLPELKLIIAPHEIHKEHIDQLKSVFPNSILHSELENQKSKVKSQNCLIIDNIGLLSRLYYYATIAYVGGGFNKGIHNTLEAAVHGKPVLFGPNYKKFREAIGLIESTGAICINSADELSSTLKKLLTDKTELEERGQRSFDFVKQNKGATEKIIHYIEEKRLLTS